MTGRAICGVGNTLPEPGEGRAGRLTREVPYCFIYLIEREAQGLKPSIWANGDGMA